MISGSITLHVASLYDVFEHPLWRVIAPVLAVAGIATSIVLYRRGRARKGLAYRLTVTPLVSVDAAARDKVAVSYDGMTVSGVHLITLELMNEGNVPIAARDFYRPITLDLGPAAIPLTTDVVEAEPPKLEPELTVAGTTVSLAPLLLNPTDRFKATALVRDYVGPSQIHGRIEGVTELVDVDQRERRRQARLRRITPIGEGIATFAGVFAAFAVVAGIGSLFGDDKDDTLVTMKRGRPLCGDVLRVDGDRIVVRLASGGRVRVVATEDVVAIREKSC